jgi:hypothetical protein
MKHSKININRATLSDAQITAGQDFGSVLKAFTKVRLPWYKATWFVASTATVLTASLVVVALFLYSGSEGETGEVFESSYAIEGPCVGVNIPFVSNSVDASEGGTLEINGSTITIPPNAFVFCDGGEVKGDVDINFRDFHDKADLLLSGIPMGYDSAGTHYDFETAGMFELRGMQDGKSVCIKDGKAVGVDLKSHFGEGFNNYNLDETTGEWDYLEPSPVVVDDCDPEVLDFTRGFDERANLLRSPQTNQASLFGVFAQDASTQDTLMASPCSSSPCVLRRGEKWTVNSSHIQDDLICDLFGYGFDNRMRNQGWDIDFEIMPVGKSTLSYTISIDDEELIAEEVIMNQDEIENSINSSLRTIEAMLEVNAEMKQDYIALEKMRPVMPKQAGTSGYQLELDFSEKDFPELAVYDKMLFEVDESRKAFDPSKANEPWTSMDVEKGVEAGSYVLVFRRADETFSVDCYPVVEGADIATAQKIFDRKLEQYQTKKAELKQEAEERKQAVLKRQAESRAAAQAAARTNQWAMMGQSANAASEVYRAFAVAEFGIYNCDQPLKFRPREQMVVTVVDEAGQIPAIGSIYLADLQKDRLVKYYPNTPVVYSANSPFMLWMIVDGNKLGIVEPEQFEAAKGKSNHQFTLSVFDEPIDDPAQVKAMLEPYLGGG